MGAVLKDVWADLAARDIRGRTAIYVAVSGNTGAGKSTLIKRLATSLAREGYDVAAVDERSFHHPLLSLMFSEPRTYSLLVQLNFLVQRCTFLRRALFAYDVVIVERSHFDDELFVRDHFDRGNITSTELAAYLQIAKPVHADLPEPDCFLLLDVGPETSLARLGDAEARGERPREFPDEATKVNFVRAWHQKYHAFFGAMTSAKESGARFASTKFLRVQNDRSDDEAFETVEAEVMERVRHARL